MKQINFRGGIPYALMLTPLLLAGCEGLQDLYGSPNTQAPVNYNYDYTSPGSKGSTPSRETPGTKTDTNTTSSLAEQATSTATTTKSTTSTVKSNPASLDGPSVPNMAPTVSQ